MHDVIAGGCGLLFFLVVQHIAAVTIPGGAKLGLDIQAVQSSVTTVSWSHAPGRFTEAHAASAEPVPAGRRHNLSVPLNDATLHSIRLDIVTEADSVSLYGMGISSHLARNRAFSPAEFIALFEPYDASTHLELAGDHVQISDADGHISLVARQPLLTAHWFARLAIPLLLSMMVFLFLRRIEWRNLPAWSDLDRKMPSSGENIAALDGLRGLAVIMVVADHTLPICKGVGAAGVLIFFALSGYLLARPFVEDSARILSCYTITEFFRRRCSRVLPMYYLYVFVIFVVGQHYDQALRHFLFLEGAGHLWAIPQEMLFYLLIVPVLLCCHLLFRGRALLVIPALVLLMLWWNHSVDKTVLPMYGMDFIKLRPMAGVFLAGVILAWTCYGTSFGKWLQVHSGWPHRFITLLGLALLGLEIFFANGMILLQTKQIYSQRFFGWYGFGAAVLVACAALTQPKSWLGRLLCLPVLRTIGVVSLSLYLLHPTVMQILRTTIPQYFDVAITSPRLFLLTLVVSYVVAGCTYSLVERPFIFHRDSIGAQQ